jgi:hypothetical protein|tara:strand:+ start:2699 stop:2899 length:201 start_codon:yes stop_codon:yes gene_type:complete
MKINELIKSFEIFITNEERAIYETIDEHTNITKFNEREQVLIQNLIRKSLVSKVLTNGQIMVIRND